MKPSSYLPKRDHLYERIANLLEDDIINGHFPDEKLPSEQALAHRYQVSRTVIREALKILGERHLVSTLVGSGAFITKPDAQDLSAVVGRLISTHDIDRLDAFDVRLILETAAASRAATNASEEELNEMRINTQKLADMSLSVEERLELDFQFHMMVIKASHNALLSLLTQAMGNLFQNVINVVVTASINDLQITRGTSHARIFNAIANRDPMAAQSTMYDHLYSAKMIYKQHIESQEQKD